MISKKKKETFIDQLSSYARDVIDQNPTKWFHDIYSQALVYGVENLQNSITESDPDADWKSLSTITHLLLPFDSELRSTIDLSERDRESVRNYVIKFLESYPKLLTQALIAINPSEYILFADGTKQIKTEVPPIEPGIRLSSKEVKTLQENTIEAVTQFGNIRIRWRLTTRFLPLTIDKPENKTYIPIETTLIILSGDPDLLTSAQKNYIFSEIIKHVKEAMPVVSHPDVGEYIQDLDYETFGLPSETEIMFPVFCIFSGKPPRIPAWILNKDKKDRTEDEQKLIDDEFLSLIRPEERSEYDVDYYLQIDHPKYPSEVKIPTHFLNKKNDSSKLSHIIELHKILNPKGLKHIYGLLIGLDEASRTGEFIWDINEHLERVGFHREKKGSYNIRLKQQTSDMIELLTSLSFIVRKDNTVAELRLFNREVTESKIRKIGQQYIMKMHITATTWYQRAFNGKTPQYTQLLKEIAKEDPNEHSLSLVLAGLLAIFWRMNTTQKLSAKNLMEWCGLDLTDKNRSRHLKGLERELDYMKEKDYLGDWKHDGNRPRLSESKDPFECVIELIPPTWLSTALKEIVKKKKQKNLPREEYPKLTGDELKAIQKESGLSVREFASKLGKSRQRLYQLFKQQGPIPQKIAGKIRELDSSRKPMVPVG